MHHGGWVESADVVQIRVGFDKQKPKNFDQFGDEENVFRNYSHTKTLAKSHAVTKHEAAYPDDKSNHQKFPYIDQWNGEKLCKTHHL